MTVSLDEAIRKLDVALGLLEAAVSRKLEAEKRRGDLETELQLMQDDRSRLAGDLDGALTRLRRHEAAAEDIGKRVRAAMSAIEGALQTETRQTETRHAEAREA